MADSHHSHMKVNLSALEEGEIVLAAFVDRLRELGTVLVVPADPSAFGVIAFMTFPCDCQGRSE